MIEMDLLTKLFELLISPALEDLVQLDPDFPQDYKDTLTKAIQALAVTDVIVSNDGDEPESVCRRPGCGLPIVMLRGGTWRHLGNDGGLYAGCRAASFTSAEGWNEDLPRTGNVMAPLVKR